MNHTQDGPAPYVVKPAVGKREVRQRLWPLIDALTDQAWLAERENALSIRSGDLQRELDEVNRELEAIRKGREERWHASRDASNALVEMVDKAEKAAAKLKVKLTDLPRRLPKITNISANLDSPTQS